MRVTTIKNHWILPFEMVISGKGGHGAMANDAIDPIVASAAVILETTRAAAEYEAALYFFKIDAGTKFNIIPEEVQCYGSLLAETQQTLEYCMEAICLIAETTAAAFRCKFSTELHLAVKEGNS